MIPTRASAIRDSALSLALLALAAVACGGPRGTESGSRPSAPAAGTATEKDPAIAAPRPPPGELAGWTAIEADARGDAARGKALVTRYECNRCHAGTGVAAPSFDHQCVGCHKAIKKESLPFPKERLDAWSRATHHFVETPDLDRVGETMRASWIASFVREPVKVRTHMEEWMPRLSISREDARDIAAYLTAGAPPPREVTNEGDAERGKDVVTRKGCFMCHAFTGAAVSRDVAMEVPELDPDVLARGIALAPDLRRARERLRPDAAARWIRDPKGVRPGAAMPPLGLTEDEARDAAAYVLTTALAPPEPPAPPLERLPLLDRRVTYEEVATRVFRVACTHCHADPGSQGDPGPGSTGGFGFAPRGVSLLSLPGVTRGYLADGGARRSLFAPEPALARWGGARLVAALVARHEETSGRPVAEVRGMPMGLPALPAEDIQLVETWVAQGAKP